MDKLTIKRSILGALGITVLVLLVTDHWVFAGLTMGAAAALMWNGEY
jgi:hypothetical protein